MAFSRSEALGNRSDDGTLTSDMVGIGMNFAAKPTRDAPIEETLVHASEVGMVEHDHRVLAVLTTWLGIHHGYVNADRLVRAASRSAERNGRAPIGLPFRAGSRRTVASLASARIITV